MRGAKKWRRYRGDVTMDDDKWIGKIREYALERKKFIGMPWALSAFFSENPGVREWLVALIEKEPWFQDISTALRLISRGVVRRQFCRTCGKELSARSVLRGSVYCSGGCKSRDPQRIAEQMASRKKNERLYCIDGFTASPEELTAFRANHNRPSARVEKAIDDFASHDSKGAGLYLLLSRDEEVNRYLGMLAFVCDWIRDKKEAFLFAKMRLYEGRRCATCGRYLSYAQAFMDHHYCSSRCAQRSSLVRGKQMQTNLEKYGARCVLSNSGIKERIKQTNLVKYGCENASSNMDVRKKREKTMMDRYGGRGALACPEVRKKGQLTSLMRYGVNHPMKNDLVKRKVIEQYLDQSYRKLLDKWPDDVELLTPREDYHGFDRCYRYWWRCKKCGSIFKQDGVYSTGLGKDGLMPRCLECYPWREVGGSFQQDELVEFVQGIYDGEVKKNDREMIAPLELDLWLPERNLAIEFDGLYWHSDAVGKDSKYHLKKTIECEKKRIFLLHVFEDEWHDRRRIVEDRIKSALGIYDRKIYARKCQVRELPAQESNAFLEENHLQGADNAGIRYGLYFEEELVAVMTFGRPRFSRKYDWELVRFASKLGMQVIGGAGKLLSHFRKSHPGSIVSYADRRYSRGKLYESLGFARAGFSAPNYWYVKGNEKLSRYECQKHRLKRRFAGNFDPECSESENMARNGYSRIYDCGSIVYLLL